MVMCCLVKQKKNQRKKIFTQSLIYIYIKKNENKR